MSYTAELHAHSEWSLLDGCGSALIGAQRAAECGHGAKALTDHGVLSGSIHHMKACREVGILPIVGVEAYYRPNRLDHNKATNWDYYHILLLAKDLRGWRSLMLLTSEAFRTGYYRKPCVDDELLDKWNDGIIASTGCVSGYVPRAILRGDDGAVRDHLDKLDRWFGEDWFFEIQPHDFDDQRVVNSGIVSLAQSRGRVLGATKDAHFPEPEWHDTQKVSVLMRTKSTLDEANRKAQEDDDYYDLTAPDTAYIGSAEDTTALFQRYHPQIDILVVERAIAGTGEIAGRVTPFTIDGSPKLPRFREDQDEAADMRQLRQLVADGIVARGHGGDERYERQAERELEVFEQRRIASFFLITWDAVDWGRSTRSLPELPGGSTPENDDFYGSTAKGGGREQPIPIGSRGSAGGCVVSYALNITQINPVTYGLRFERFLNPNRAGMPDIDLDFPDWGARLMEEYIKRRYGRDKAYDLVAHGTFGPRSALRRVSTVYGVPYQEAMAVTKLIPDDDAKDNTPLEDLRKVIVELDRYAEAHEGVWRDACRLQRQIQSISEHPAGVALSRVPLDQIMPVMKKAKGDDYMVTAFGEEASMEIVTKVFGLMKFDLLILNELAKHAYAEQLIRRIYDVDMRLDRLPVYEDPYAVEPEVMRRFCTGELMGVFQFSGSPGIMRFTKRVEPENLLHLTAINAIYRPATLAASIHDEYVARRHDPSRIDYWDPSVKPLLEETLGLMVYQEQVMDILVALGGFSPARADDVRKIMSKYYRAKGDLAERMLGEHKADFISSSSSIISTGVRGAEAVWDHMGGFSSYSFNKPHAGEYALKGYSDQWLKVNYPEVLYCSLLSFPPAKIKKPEERKPWYERVVREARARGVEILPPDVNDSDQSFTVTAEGVRFGLGAVAGLGAASIADVVAGRPYDTMEQLVEWTSRKGAKSNAGSRRALGGAGALDRFGAREHLSLDERCEAEEQRLGIVLSAPDRIGELKEPLRRILHTAAEVEDSGDGETLIVGGELISGEERKTRKGVALKFVLAFGADEYRCSLAPWLYTDAVRELVDLDEALVVRGHRDKYYDCVAVDEIRLAREVVEEMGFAPRERGRVSMEAFA